MIHRGIKYCVVALSCMIVWQVDARTPGSPWNLKTNLISDVTTTLNLSPEICLSGRSSLDLTLGWNPWKFANHRQWRHILVQPEWRIWTRRTFSGHFFGLHAHYVFYNIGNLPEPFSPWIRSHRVQGSAIGAGVSYGYRWCMGMRWDMEATLGVGYAYLDYKKYSCDNCQQYLGHQTRNYFGPTRLALNLIYKIGKPTTAYSLRRKVTTLY